MAITLGLGMGLRFTGSAGGGVTLLTGATMDDFSTVTTTMNGTSLQPYAGATWIQNSGTTGTVNNPQVSADATAVAAKSLRVNVGAGVTTPAVWYAPGSTTASRHYSFRLNPDYGIVAGVQPSAFSVLHDIVVITDHTSYSQISHRFGPTSNQGAITEAWSPTGSLAAQTNFSGVLPASSMTGRSQGVYAGIWPGDTYELRKRTSGAQVFFDEYLNGRIMISGTHDFAADAGMVINDTAGVKGDGQTNTPNLISFFEHCDPDTQARLTVQLGGHTAQLKWWDGNAATAHDTLVRLKGEYTLGAPPAVYASVINAATGAVVSGPTAITGYTAAAGVWSGTITIANASTPASFWVKVERQDIVSAQKRYAFTPIMRPGWNVLGFGQSLMTQMWQSIVTGITVVAGANNWVTDGSVDGNAAAFATVARDRRCNLMASTANINNSISTPAYMLQIPGTDAGHTNFNFIRGGLGGTLQSTRQPGAGFNIYEAAADGIDLCGDVGIVLFDGGTFEINNAPASNAGNVTQGNFAYGANTITYKGLLDTFLTALETKVGHPVMMILSPPPAINGDGTAVVSGSTIDQRSINLARACWELVQTNGAFGTVTGSNPQRYYQGPYTYELQHSSGDPYHLNSAAADGYGEEGRRFGYSLSKTMGYRSDDRNGATIDATTTPVRTATTVAVTFNANGATALSADNTAFASDFRCGMHFFKGGTPTGDAGGTGTEILPTAVSVAAVSGGKATVTWTFGVADLLGTITVTGPWGMCPYNRASNASITTNMLLVAGAKPGRAAILTSTFADPQTLFFGPGVQPYFNASFLTNDTHDYLTST